MLQVVFVFLASLAGSACFTFASYVFLIEARRRPRRA